MKNRGKRDKSKQSPQGRSINLKTKFFVINPKFPREKIDESLAQDISNTGKNNEKYASMKLKKWVGSIMVRFDKNDLKNLEI